MQIHLESHESNSIQSYTDSHVVVNHQDIKENVIISRESIIYPWSAQSIHELCENQLTPILNQKPEVILIGHNETQLAPPVALLHILCQQQIGLELMSIGAACRTFNVLLSEHRRVVIGLVF